MCMRVRKHFRTSQATIDYIIADFSLNRISNRETYLMLCANERINRLNEEYNNKLDKLLDFIILRCNFNNMPVTVIAKMMYSLTKVTNAVTKGLLSLIKE